IRKQVSDVNHAVDRGFIDHDEFVQKVRELTGKSSEQIEHSRTGGNSKNMPLLHYIAELKKNYKIGLISNISTPWITEEFLTSDEQQLFDDMVLSYKTGITKPDPHIFEVSCANLGVEPSQAIFI